MDNQHKKISGYRDLTETEVEIMNEIKQKERETLALMDKLTSVRKNQRNKLIEREQRLIDGLSAKQLGESSRCRNIAKEKLQTGFSWFVRSVALPE